MKDRDFFRLVLTISIPVIFQYLVTDMAGLLDSIMVGKLTLEEITGVTIASQIISIIASCMSGCTVSASIYESQYHTVGDNRGIQEVIRYKIVCCLVIYVSMAFIIMIFHSDLIKLFVNDNTCDLNKVIIYGKEYMGILCLGLIFYLLSQVFMSTMVDIGKTKIPFMTSLISITYNLIMNYLLIFGKCGFPALGSKGAAIATASSHLVSIIIILGILLIKRDNYPFLNGLFKTFRISKHLLIDISRNGLLLILGGFTWNLGNTLLVQNYSMMGVSAVLAVTISFKLISVLRLLMSSFGETIIVILGRYIGVKSREEIIHANNLIIKCAFILSLILMTIGFILAPIYPSFFNVPKETRDLIQYCLVFYSSMFIFNCLDQVGYYTLTAGGKTWDSFKFDSGFIFVVYLPLSFILTRFTVLNFKTVFFIVQIFEVLKCYLIFSRMRKNEWITSSI